MTVYSPEQYLRELIESGQLRSRYEEYVNQLRRSNHPSGTFYTRTLAEKGVGAAEAELQEWNTRLRRSDYASLLEPVARGMMALEETEKGSVKLVMHDTTFPLQHYLLSSGKMIVMINRGAPGCGCMQPQGSDIFSPSGRLGIKAVLLSAFELGIVLPVRRYEYIDFENRKDGFTVARIGLDGYTDADTYIPVYPDSNYLMKMIGLTEGPIPVGMCASGGHFDDGVGFPGATNYLVDNLPRLEEYFSNLGINHKH